jgi:dethiobiotin synthetase
MKLGCLNHALLTEAVLEHQQLKCIGWIANCIEPKMLMINENIETLKRMLKSPLLGIAEYGKEIQCIHFEPFLR